MRPVITHFEHTVETTGVDGLVAAYDKALREVIECLELTSDHLEPVGSFIVEVTVRRTVCSRRRASEGE